MYFHFLYYKVVWLFVYFIILHLKHFPVHKDGIQNFDESSILNATVGFCQTLNITLIESITVNLKLEERSCNMFVIHEQQSVRKLLF